MNLTFHDVDGNDKSLIRAATETLIRCYRDKRHTVAAAVRCASGLVYTGVNIDSCGYGPCAEPIAIGAAITAGERDIDSVVAVCRRGDQYDVLSPCGNCRQMLVDYAPDAIVIFRIGNEVKKARAADLLPGSYVGFKA
jgi:cytidine deaminase